MLQLAHTLVLLVKPPTMAPVVLLLVSKGNHSQPQKAAMVQVLVVLVVTTPVHTAQLVEAVMVVQPLFVLLALSLMCP